ncbi:phospholipase D-like domain-containing protein [Burkholderia sp. MR1-5-21]
MSDWPDEARSINEKDLNVVDCILKSQNPANVAIDEQARVAKSSAQWLLEKRTDIAPITYENHLDFFICGDEGFANIANDLKLAKETADIVCWGFDPGMELIREDGKNEWPRGQTYGELLEDIVQKGVTVRLMVWYQETASAKQNNVPGFSDIGHNVLKNPAAWAVGSSSSPYNSERRQKYCIDWWKRHRPNGNCSGTNKKLLITFRSIDAADASHSLADEKDKPQGGMGPTNERALMTAYPTHHQKPILIDYNYNQGSKAVGYVMGLNSVTDYWDRSAHEIDDPHREALASGKLKEERKHEEATQGNPGTNGYVHGRPYQDYACRVFGPALKRLHENFVRDWNHYAPDEYGVREVSGIPANIQKVSTDPNHAVQIVRTHPRDEEKTIKELYFHASSWARNYIYIENQYFFYPAFARQLKETRKGHWKEWVPRSGKPSSEMGILYLFIVIPHPEDDGMIPRTYDMLTELGASDPTANNPAMADQGKYVAANRVSQDYPDAKTVTYTLDTPDGPITSEYKVLDHPSVQELASTYGIKVSVARLRASGQIRSRDMAYREIYIHSKLMIIDDVFITVGSANLNQRSMSSDSEINIGATGVDYAATLRERVFKLHSGGDIPGSGNPADVPDVFKAWNRRMTQNRDVQLTGKQKLKGFLLPFEDHRATSTMHASVTIPSSGDTALA